MIRRRTNKKKRLTQKAVANGDEPPDPITLTVIAATGAVIGAAGTAFGAVAAKQQASQQAALANANAQATARDAMFARDQAAFNEARSREQASRVAGRQRAGIGASGVDFSGSPLDLLQETAIQSELDAQSIRRTGEFRAQGLDFQAEGDQYRANAYRAQGNTALTSGMISAGSQLASGLGGASMNRIRMQGTW